MATTGRSFWTKTAASKQRRGKERESKKAERERERQRMGVDSEGWGKGLRGTCVVLKEPSSFCKWGEESE